MPSLLLCSTGPSGHHPGDRGGHDGAGHGASQTAALLHWLCQTDVGLPYPQTTDQWKVRDLRDEWMINHSTFEVSKESDLNFSCFLAAVSWILSLFLKSNFHHKINREFVELSLYHSFNVPSLQISRSISCEEKEDHPADHGPGCGASVRHSSHLSAGREWGRHREAVGWLPKGPQARLLLRYLTKCCKICEITWLVIKLHMKQKEKTLPDKVQGIGYTCVARSHT